MFKEQRDVSSYGNLVCNEDNICNYDYEFKPGEMLMTEDCYVYSYDRIIRHDFKLGPNDTVVPANSSVFDPFTRLNSQMLTISTTSFSFEKLSKSDMLNEWNGKYVIAPDRFKYDTYGGCFYVTNSKVAISYDDNVNCNKYAKDVWIEDSGKLCIEYNFKDDCRKVRKFENGVYKFGSQKMKVLDNL
jgi:hypothetical protein